jgi:hypothetical protein
MITKEIWVKRESFFKICKNKDIKTTPVISCVVATYGPEPVGYGGEEVLELSFELKDRPNIRYLCHEHRY